MFVAVWSLATRIPIPRLLLAGDAALPSADAITLFPLVGGVIAVVTALPAWGAAYFIPLPAAAWAACGLYVIFGWSLHLDGWGDLWDGVGSGRRGEAMRAVMKDSRVGSFGVAGIVLALALRATLLAGIDAGRWLPSLAIAGGAGRFALSAAAYVGHYPWEAGMGREIVNNFEGRHVICSLVLSCLFIPLNPGACLAGIAASGLAGAALAMWCDWNLGGVNGDALGAAAVLGEIIALACCAV
jgi:adenosylcobinamide-GDP ribazoletransferase